MANNYYNFSPSFVPGTKVRSDEVNTQYSALEAAFDLLPAENTSLTRGTNIVGAESGSGNAYVVTMPDTRLSYQEGDRLIFRATHTNTDAATIDVDGIGPVALVRPDDSVIVSGDILTGVYFEAIYHLSENHFQLLTPTAGQLGDLDDRVDWATEWAIQPEDTPVTVAAGGDGSTTFSALHWAAKGSDSAAAASTSAGNAATSETNSGLNVGYASDWAIEAEDTPVSIAAGGDGSTTFSALHWAAKAEASAASSGLPAISGGDALKRVRVNALETAYELATDGRFGNVQVQTNQIMITDTGGSLELLPNGSGSVNVNQSDTIDLIDTSNALNIGTDTPISAPHLALSLNQIQSKTDETSTADLSINELGGNLSLGPQSGIGQVALYNNGLIRLIASASGVVQLRGDGNTDTEVSYLSLLHQDGTPRGGLGYTIASNILFIDNYAHAGPIFLRGEKSNGSKSNLITGDPDGSVSLYDVGIECVRSEAPTNGGLLVNNTLTGTGLERALTASDISSSVDPRAVKETATTTTADTTFTTDPDLQVAVLNDTLYLVEAFLLVTSNSTADFKMHVNTSTNAQDAEGSAFYMTKSGTAISMDTQTWQNGSTMAMSVPSTDLQIHIKGYIKTPVSSAQSVVIRWAQNVSNAVTTSVDEGSWLKVTKVG